MAAARPPVTTPSRPGPVHVEEGQTFQPFRDFVGPARRRTDHPWVVGTIVLCLGMTTLASIVQITVLAWAGSQVKEMILLNTAETERSAEARKVILKDSEQEAMVLRRVCLNTAKDDSDRRECLTLRQKQ